MTDEQHLTPDDLARLDAITAVAEAQLAAFRVADAGRPKAVYPDGTLNSLRHWFPRIAAAGLPVPRTEIVLPTPEDSYLLCEAVYDLKPDLGAVDRIADLIRAAAARVVGDGRPFFLRTDLTSGKHSWRDSCHVADWSRLSAHVCEITNYSGCCVDAFPAVWVVRELLTTRPLFTAFHGRMPITREFRFFVEAGVVSHVQPYWPASSIDDVAAEPGSRPDVPDWRDRLAAASVLVPDERTMLGRDSLIAAAAAGGDFSVDWLETADRGWVLTDMAIAWQSYRWNPEAEANP